ncbi:helix-hairpin-helix domain-containing protein [Halanaerobacter jeridensis]|uniref:Competence ComEA-like helix-hairpin-helix protein n=1 Tax=Halanaerobacter jeridensis TaxID=706427 RepID=A0A938XS05_9FIRM|nr:helix-hairpin-helix domain-containing protein [Halanaerobacter jeridensis]MBM7556724.1 competence ComEA-like helix-hairpin-helix protein [Halanaerobacter jeridensis]
MAQVNVNQADQNRLTDLEHVGPVLAERIADYRQDNDGFVDLDDLKNVKGIGDKLYSDIKADNQLKLSPTAETNKGRIEEENIEDTKVKEAKIDLDIPPAERIDELEKDWVDEEEKLSTVEEKSREEHCPALRSCPVYKEEYCEGNYEECARYKIISSSLNSSHIPEILLPTEKERADAILENNL